MVVVIDKFKINIPDIRRFKTDTYSHIVFRQYKVGTSKAWNNLVTQGITDFRITENSIQV